MRNSSIPFESDKIILFVGAGVSKNLDFPLIDSLIDEFADLSGYHPEVYKTFGDNRALAEYYFSLDENNINYFAESMLKKCQDPSIGKSEIHESIVKAKFPIIYTTNYDNFLEESYSYHKKECTKIVGVSDIKKIKEGVTQIIKFHGDLDNPNTIVLSESSYFDRLEFENHLDIKLRSDVMRRSVLFIGYSLSDVNLRFIFYKLAKLWKSNSNNGMDQHDHYLFTHRPNQIQEKILKQWGIKMIISEECDPEKALLEFLKKFW